MKLAQQFDSRNAPPLVEPILVAAAAFLTAVLIIVALLVAAG